MEESPPQDIEQNAFRIASHRILARRDEEYLIGSHQAESSHSDEPEPLSTPISPLIDEHPQDRHNAQRTPQNVDAEYPIPVYGNGGPRTSLRTCNQCRDYSSKAQWLCDPCRKESLPYSIICSGSHDTSNSTGSERTFKQMEETSVTCSFCAIVVRSIRRNRQIAGFRDGWSNFDAAVDISRIPNVSGPQGTGGIYAHLSLKREQRNETRIPYLWDATLLVSFRRELMLLSDSTAKEAVNWDCVSGWLKRCEKDHSVGCVNPQIARWPETFRLIDVQRRCIVSAPENCRYVTLSYVWGAPRYHKLVLTKSNLHRLEKEGSLTNKVLPATLDDAIYACLALREKYLWIDSICVIQDDEFVQRAEIDRMGDIYSNGYCMLVAAAGDNADSGLPGVHHRMRKVDQQCFLEMDVEALEVLPNFSGIVENSPWNTRGWTFQENILARRCIFFTETQVFFTCTGLTCHEDPAVATIGQYLASSTSFQSDFSSRTRGKDPFSEYKRRVAEYSKRILTSPSDILDAFIGISKSLYAPFVEQLVFGLPSSNINEALLWEPDYANGPFRKRWAGRKIVFPSWSWISHHGHVQYWTESFIGSLITVQVCLKEDEPLFKPPVTKSRINDDRLSPLLRYAFKSLHDRAPKQDLSLPLSGHNLEFEDTAFWGYEPISEQCDLIEKYAPDALVAVNQPGRMIFYSESAFFTLRECGLQPLHVIDNLITTLAIISRSNEMVGFIDMDQVWSSLYLSSEPADQEWFQFIAISVSATPQTWLSRIQGQKETTAPESATNSLYFDSSTGFAFTPPPTLNVMLIEWQDGVAHRLGIGKVFQKTWIEAGPKRVTIVLE